MKPVAPVSATSGLFRVRTDPLAANLRSDVLSPCFNKISRVGGRQHAIADGFPEGVSARRHGDGRAVRLRAGVRLEHSLLELVKLRASQINRCAYCIDMHAKELRAAGESEQRIYLLDAWQESPFYSYASALRWPGRKP